MTTDLEKQFFDTFGIEPKEHKACDSIPCGNPRAKCENCKEYKLYKTEYPQITNRILLELICIDYTENPYKCRGYVSNAQELKNYLLGQFIHEFENDLYLDKENVKQQVQALFKEGI